MMLFNYKNYIGCAEFDEEAKIFSGRVININRDVVTFWGETPEEAYQEFITSIDGYLEFCEEEHLHPETPLCIS